MNALQAAATLPERVVLRGVSKRFGSTLALSGVSLAGRAGSIHAITGENGAGKSTLMKILAGVHSPDAGEVCINGVPVRLATPAAARRAGVSTVFQELTILPNLSVAENIALGREPMRHAQVHRRAMQAMAHDVLDRVGIRLDPRRPCAELTIGEQQMLEIGKGLAANADIFIFDEPTAPLNRREVDRLEALLQRLRDQGKAIFYISHRLEEIFRLCDTVSVLKDGQNVCTRGIGDLTPDSLVSLMVGRELKALFPARTGREPGSALLSVEKLASAPGGAEVSFTLRAGEIVGVAGLEGQGQHELMRVLAGTNGARAGEVRLQGAGGTLQALPTRRSARSTVRHGLVLMPEDRKSEGLYLDLPIEDNIWLGGLRGRRLWQLARRPAATVRALAERMRLRSHPRTPVGALSGGNQQKVMLGRWLASGAQVLLVEQPTRGVDVAAKAEIYALLHRFVDEGGTVLAVSGDLIELIGLCDRILVMRRGAVVADVPAHEATEDRLLSLALQEAEEARADAAANDQEPSHV